MSILSVALDSGKNSTWLTLPATAEELNKALLDIGALDRGYSIGDYRTPIGGNWIKPFIVDGNINEVNYLAARLAKLHPKELEMLEAVMESPMRFEGIGQVIDFSYNTEYFVLIPDIHTTEDLARHYIFESGMVQMPRQWKDAIDLYAFGTNLEEQEKGAYTAKGYLVLSGDEWKKVYEKTAVVPPEYRIDNYLKNAEQTVEQNYNQIDGIINNEGPRRADLTDGQTYKEIAELAPETLRQPDEKPSILGQLKEAQADVSKPGPVKDKNAPDLDL